MGEDARSSKYADVTAKGRGLRASPRVVVDPPKLGESTSHAESRSSIAFELLRGLHSPTSALHLGPQRVFGRASIPPTTIRSTFDAFEPNLCRHLRYQRPRAGSGSGRARRSAVEIGKLSVRSS